MSRSPPSTARAAVLAGRWSWSSALVMIPLLIGVSHALVGERPSRRALLVTSLLSAVLIAGLWIGEAMITNSWYVRTDRLSGAYLAAAPGPLQPVVLPYILAAFAYCMRVMARARSLGVWERRLFLGGIAVVRRAGAQRRRCTPRRSSRAGACSTSPSSASRWA